MSDEEETLAMATNEASDPGMSKKKLIVASAKKEAVLRGFRDEEISVLLPRVRMSRSPLLGGSSIVIADDDSTDGVIYGDWDPTDRLRAFDMDPTDSLSRTLA